MRRFTQLSAAVSIIVLSFIFSANASAEKAPESIKTLAEKLVSWGTNPVLVAAVQEQNGKNTPLEEIKKLDAQWQETSGVNDFMKALLNNTAAQELKKMEDSLPYLFECFLMDNQGANVAMTNKTSDYWQGDEAKFQQSYNGGEGKVHIGDVEFDDSAQAYQVQISVPVVDAGKTIGALTIGVNLDAYEESLK